MACLVNSDCGGAFEARKTHVCNESKKCEKVSLPPGSTAGVQTMGDCQVTLCDGFGNTYKQQDNSDVPLDNPETAMTAAAMAHITTFRALLEVSAAGAPASTMTHSSPRRGLGVLFGGGRSVEVALGPLEGPAPLLRRRYIGSRPCCNALSMSWGASDNREKPAKPPWFKASSKWSTNQRACASPSRRASTAALGTAIAYCPPLTPAFISSSPDSTTSKEPL